MFDHWEISVEKLERGGYGRSYTRPRSGEVFLDSEDLRSNEFAGGNFQRAVVHEFGHMMGQPDEYKPGAPDERDSASVMNVGEQIRDRHLYTLKNWLEGRLKKLGVE